MKKFVICFLLLIVSLPAVALEDGPVMYVGGTRADVHAGVVGSLDITSETALIFKYTGSTLVIPYASIESVQYLQEVTRHLGVLRQLLSDYWQSAGAGISSISHIAILRTLRRS
jgi:hypothetical protein